MLTIFGEPHARGGFCDGVSRRDFLTVGGTLLGGGLSLPRLLAAEADSGVKHSHRAIINVYLPGGPPHQDMWDLKPDAPKEVRGEFNPIATNVTGIQIGETFKRIAKSADKFAFIRSVVGARGGHDAFQCTTGWTQQSLAGLGGRPSLGSAVWKLQGNVDASVPPFIGLAEPTTHKPWSDSGQTGFLGSTYGAFTPSGP